MDIFAYRNQLLKDYEAYVKSFIRIRDTRIAEHVRHEFDRGALWPESLLQLNPAFEPGHWIDELVSDGMLDEMCAKIFRRGKGPNSVHGQPLRLHKHQSEAIQIAASGKNYVLTTGTGSGKSLGYILPIVDRVLRRGSGKGVQAIVVYPMNALANSQEGELKKFLEHGFAEGASAVTFRRYTGQESDSEKLEIRANPPDIILTNYIMLELILTRPEERSLIDAAADLQFLVLDELHTYRGRQGADVALLVRRTRNRLGAPNLQCVGTSATLASTGSLAEQQLEIARIATKLFGSDVQPESVIGESLRRITPERSFADAAFVSELATRLRSDSFTVPTTFEAFRNDPIAGWIESTFGVQKEPESRRLRRSNPRPIAGEQGAARELGELTGVPESVCEERIRRMLLGGYNCEPNPETAAPAFAFRLHQFISRGDTVYASLEPPDKRYITIVGQSLVPGGQGNVLLPLAFCRECGQEYYCVHEEQQKDSDDPVYVPRDIGDQFSDAARRAGFLYFSADNPWPEDGAAVLQRLPDDWTEPRADGTTLKVKRNYRDYMPVSLRLSPKGERDEDGLAVHFVPAPFRFCLGCGVTYDSRQRSDFPKLSSLTSEGRSTATTILSLSAIRSLRKEESLTEKARKLLSFTDNRQDASLQAGHFNDFVEIGVLRSALYRAVDTAGASGITHEQLTQKTFEALALPFEVYALNSAARFQARHSAEKALRDVIGYHVYRDLKRGWRVTAPNLEQCGLLEINYACLDEVAAAEDLWHSAHPALATATPETRSEVAGVLLDFLRRSLAINVPYLDQTFQDQIRLASNQHLVEPWALDENDTMQYATIAFPRPQTQSDTRGLVFLSPRGGFGQFLSRMGTFAQHPGPLRLDERRDIILQLLRILVEGDLVLEVVPGSADAVPGYQLRSSALIWKAGQGTRSFRDPIRVPNPSQAEAQTNAFFLNFYRTVAAEAIGLKAREHTAQVPYEQRQQREQEFREGRLPILYCSPTMELGVDISELNVVNLRNVPPTPANYAQRSGRAGRSGQPALVFAYCTTGSSHDQYFFKHPDRMVAGAVTPPRLDIANEDLIRAHVQAVWLSETGMKLGMSLRDILDVSGENPSLALLEEKHKSVSDEASRRRAEKRAAAVLDSIRDDLDAAEWYSPSWLRETLAQVSRRFDQACERWRSLYRSALSQAKAQDRIIRDASRSGDDKKVAERLRREAESQIKLLNDVDSIAQSDFYSYRYFASEGFLPGYSFPRLPLSAFIPSRRNRQRDEYISRPRFLAVSEFGPRAIVYYEGCRYEIRKVIMPVEEDGVLTHQAKLCQACGYLHPVTDGTGASVCESCGVPLELALDRLFRLQNVSTVRRERISSDEEERMRLGYEIISGVRFPEQAGRPIFRTAHVAADSSALAVLTYSHAATLWRINLGWARRRDRSRYGFVLDTERGIWSRSDQPGSDSASANGQDAGDDDPMSPQQTRVVPFVEDRKNCLLLKPAIPMSFATMVSLQAALKSAIQVEYQLEDSELAAELLPSRSESPQQILLYESAEGGAGVLRRLLDDPQALPRVARQALRLCHFHPETGDDVRRAPRAREDCEVACYDCLMSYYNQRNHRDLNRHVIRDLLLQFARAKVESSPTTASRQDHFERLVRLAGSDLERSWLTLLRNQQLSLPAKAQELVEACKTRPDFLYPECNAAIYIDGPPHDFPERQVRDAALTSLMENHDFMVIRFRHTDDWLSVIAKHPSVFGKAS